MGRKVMCSYCYQLGHNKNSCPKVKAEAATGNAFAQRIADNAKIKQCSYCRSTEHTKATCEKFYGDARAESARNWIAMLAAVKIIQDKKLGNGAFVFAAVPYSNYDFPHEETSEYDHINISINDIGMSIGYAEREDHGVITYSTLAEAKGRERFRRSLPMPGLYREVVESSTEFDFAKDSFIENNNRYYSNRETSRKFYEDSFEVLVPAADEEVQKIVQRILDQKPLILQSDNRKDFQRAQRALNKANKQGE